MRPFTSVVPALLFVLSVTAPGCSRTEAGRATRAFEEGQRLAREHKSAEAVAKFDEAIALQRDHLPARVGRARALQGLKRHDEAITEFDLVLRVDPNSAAALEGRGISKEAQRIGSGLDDINTALRGSGATAGQTPRLVTGVPEMILSAPARGGGSRASAVLQGGSSRVPELGSYFRDVLQRQQKGRKSPLRELMEKTSAAPADLAPILDWADLSLEELDKQFEKIERAAPRAEVENLMPMLDGITNFIRTGKKDPTKPSTSLEWSFTFDGPAFLADYYNMPLVAYFPGTTDWKTGIKALGPLVPFGNKAYFYLASAEYEPARGEVAQTTELFGITTHPTMVVVRVTPVVKGGPKKENLVSQVRCEGRPMTECAQQIAAWFNAR
jgi:tetratricopeptide (TPR) repeat protein